MSALIFDREAIAAARDAGKACGRGLGLAAARELVEGLGGTIRVVPSRGDVGTSIAVRIPLA